METEHRLINGYSIGVVALGATEDWLLSHIGNSSNFFIYLLFYIMLFGQEVHVFRYWPFLMCACLMNDLLVTLS